LTLEKPLPSNIEAEKAFLGSLLIDPDALHTCNFVISEDFYRTSHQKIFTSMCELYSSGTAADFLTLSDQLEQSGELDECGGQSYIISLVNSVPTSGNAAHYARIIVELAQLRRAIEAGTKIVAAAYERTRAVEVINTGLDLLYKINMREAITRDPILEVGELAQMRMSEYDTLYETYHGRGGLVGVPTGLYQLDTLTGGMRKGNLYVFVARPGEGKTAFVVTMGINARRLGFNGIFFSLEMERSQIMDRILGRIANIPIDRLAKGHIFDGEWGDLVAASDYLQESSKEGGQLFIDHTTGLNPMQMRARTLSKMAELPVHYIMVDYINRAKPTVKQETMVLDLGSIVQDLKSLARDLGIPVVLLGQLNRQGADVPELGHIKGSGDIEQESDFVGAFFRPVDKLTNEPEERGTKPMTVILDILKHRQGQADVELNVTFHPTITTFKDPYPGKEEEF
jgi:replicative DNA helicase